MNAESTPKGALVSTGVPACTDVESSAPADTENYWQDRANEVAAWLPTATREAVEAFAWRHFQRAESAAWCIADGHRRDRLLAQREASLAISAALDWTAQSSRPSHFELVQRRSEVAS